jgi:hypothetical protein
LTTFIDLSPGLWETVIQIGGLIGVAIVLIGIVSRTINKRFDERIGNKMNIVKTQQDTMKIDFEKKGAVDTERFKYLQNTAEDTKAILVKNTAEIAKVDEKLNVHMIETAEKHAAYDSKINQIERDHAKRSIE